MGLCLSNSKYDTAFLGFGLEDIVLHVCEEFCLWSHPRLEVVKELSLLIEFSIP